MTLPAEIALIIGIIVGALVTFVWRHSERQQLRPAPREEPSVSADTSAVLAALRSSAVLLRPDGHVIQASAPAHELGLITDDRLRNPELQALVSEVVRDGIVREESFAIARRRRAPAHVVARVAPLSADLVLALVEDKTSEHRIQTLRRDFVANSSHELKTPIGAINLLAEAVSEARDDPEAVERFAARLQTESQRLTLLIQQIIDLSRIQDDEAISERAAVSLADLATEALERSETDARAKNIQLSLTAPEPAHAYGNRMQLLSAISNLVENAVTYSPEDSKVSVSVKHDGADALIVVTDNGIGIDLDDRNRVFERFYRVDPARARSTGGTGLGLSIVKHVAASHGGTIDLWSEPGVGSTFTMRLPIWDAEEGESDDQNPAG